MKYDEDTDWGGTDEDGEDEAEFVCMRKVRPFRRLLQKKRLDSEILVKPFL